MDHAEEVGQLFPPVFAAPLRRDVTSVVAYLHAAGDAHGDVRAGNVLFECAPETAGAAEGNVSSSATDGAPIAPLAEVDTGIACLVSSTPDVGNCRPTRCSRIALVQY